MMIRKYCLGMLTIPVKRLEPRLFLLLGVAGAPCLVGVAAGNVAKGSVLGVWLSQSAGFPASSPSSLSKNELRSGKPELWSGAGPDFLRTGSSMITLLVADVGCNEEKGFSNKLLFHLKVHKQNRDKKSAVCLKSLLRPN